MYIWINGASIKSFWGKLPIILLANSQKVVLKGLYTHHGNLEKSCYLLKIMLEILGKVM